MFSLQTGWSESASWPCAREIRIKTGVNLINILCAGFEHADTKSTERYWRFHIIFTLLGSLRKKAVRNHVDEIDTWSPMMTAAGCINIIEGIVLTGIVANNLWDHFLSTSPKFYKQLLQRYSLAKKLQSQTEIRKKLMLHTFKQKSRSQIVDEIDPRCHF